MSLSGGFLSKALFGKNKLGPVYSQFIPNLFCDFSCQLENKLADLLLHTIPAFRLQGRT